MKICLLIFNFSLILRSFSTQRHGPDKNKVMMLSQYIHNEYMGVYMHSHQLQICPTGYSDCGCIRNKLYMYLPAILPYLPKISSRSSLVTLSVGKFPIKTRLLSNLGLSLFVLMLGGGLWAPSLGGSLSLDRSLSDDIVTYHWKQIQYFRYISWMDTGT